MIQANTKKEILHHILYGIFWVLFLLEPLAKFMYDPSSTLRLKAGAKLVLLAILVGYTVFLKIKKEVLYYIIALSMCFLLGQLLLTEKHSIFGGDFMGEVQSGDIYIFIKYIFILFFVGVYVSGRSSPMW